MRLARKRFQQLVAEALDAVPEPFQSRLDNVEVIVEEVPPPEIQSQFKGGLLLGLYQGVPQPRRSVMSMQLPDLISIYQRNIEAVCRSEAEIRRQVRDTVVHEIGHHFGLDEEELSDI